ncbi:hypothetical protein EVAR_100599_1 [Eumeta japonica]|uniref:Uncharacterized protein n=1 Tax=Eumeta variegata TaxID=151549 RepID=A0A4C2A257_EUMVA|nr:hypothetical protein EVAR_100599_1 [Eumeta japonica]
MKVLMDEQICQRIPIVTIPFEVRSMVWSTCRQLQVMHRMSGARCSPDRFVTYYLRTHSSRAFLTKVNITSKIKSVVLGFGIPAWTSFQIVYYISSTVGITRDFGRILQFCELYRHEIEMRARVLGGLRVRDRGSLRTMPLCAGIVMTVITTSPCYHQNVNAIMRITKLSISTLKCISDAITETIWEHVPI